MEMEQVRLIFTSLFNNLVPIAIFGAMPVLIIWLIVRHKKEETENRTKIVLAAIEKNPDIDLEELIRKITPTSKPKLLKQQLLTKLLIGSIISLVGFAGLCANIWIGFVGSAPTEMLFIMGGISGIVMAIGIAFLVNYFIGKKMLANEIEAEEKSLTSKAEK